MEFEKHALILAIIEKLHERGSRTSKTHVQKAMFLLSVAEHRHVPFAFVLYKHGPYSFDIERELEQMKSYAALAAEPAEDGYGVVLQPGEMAWFPKKRTPLSPEVQKAVKRVCDFVAAKNAVELERLATAAWIRAREKVVRSEEVADRLHALKPHVSVPEAAQADRELTSLLS